MKTIVLVSVVALLAAGCAPKPAPAPVAAINGPAECAQGGLAPGSQAYNDCVSSLSGAGPAMSANATQMQADIQNQIAQQRAQMQQQMLAQQQQMSNSTAGCTTTRDANNNVSTVCP